MSDVRWGLEGPWRHVLGEYFVVHRGQRGWHGIGSKPQPANRREDVGGKSCPAQRNPSDTHALPSWKVREHLWAFQSKGRTGISCFSSTAQTLPQRPVLRIFHTLLYAVPWFQMASHE